MKNQGITVLSEGNGKVAADIVFVHGLSGDALETWTTKTNVCWPKEFPARDLPNARVMTWGYDVQIASLHNISKKACSGILKTFYKMSVGDGGLMLRYEIHTIFGQH